MPSFAPIHLHLFISFFHLHLFICAYSFARLPWYRLHSFIRMPSFAPIHLHLFISFFHLYLFIRAHSFAHLPRHYVHSFVRIPSFALIIRAHHSSFVLICTHSFALIHLHSFICTCIYVNNKYIHLHLFIFFPSFFQMNIYIHLHLFICAHSFAFALIIRTHHHDSSFALLCTPVHSFIYIMCIISTPSLSTNCNTLQHTATHCNAFARTTCINLSANTDPSHSSHSKTLNDIFESSLAFLHSHSYRACYEGE